MKYVVFVLGFVFMVYEIISLILNIINHRKEKSNSFVHDEINKNKE